MFCDSLHEESSNSAWLHNHVLTCFFEFSAPLFVQSHLLINYRISSSKNLPANRKRGFVPESANGILRPFFATPSIELKKRICIVSISRHNPFGKLLAPVTPLMTNGSAAPVRPSRLTNPSRTSVPSLHSSNRILAITGWPLESRTSTDSMTLRVVF